MTVGDTRHTDAGEEEKKKIEGKRKREKEKEAGRWGGTLLFIRVFVASRESERCETSSEPSPRGEILQFKQSKQLFSLMHILVLLQAGSLPTAAAAVAVSVAHLAGRGARGGENFSQMICTSIPTSHPNGHGRPGLVITLPEKLAVGRLAFNNVSVGRLKRDQVVQRCCYSLVDLSNIVYIQM